MALPMTVLNEAPLSVTLMPSVAQEAFMAVNSSVWVAMPDEYCSWNFSGVPAGIPAPQSPLPVPALMQVSVPLGTTFHPLATSRALALAGLYG